VDQLQAAASKHDNQKLPALSDLRFFFSSRRRHTRSKRDWSSDVCSSDLPGPQIAQVQLDLSQEQSLRRFANRHTAVRDKHASPPNGCIASTPRLRALRPHQTIDQFLSLIVSGGHVVHDLRSLPTRSRSINQRLNRLPLPMSEHGFRLTCLVNRQLARIVPTTRVMQERLTKNA